MLRPDWRAVARTRARRPIVVLYDSHGHAATRVREAVWLLGYVVHPAQVVHRAETQGVSVSVRNLGAASGGDVVTATCRYVLALPGARIRVLPSARR